MADATARDRAATRRANLLGAVVDAATFLTRLPVGRRPGAIAETGAAAFGLVGAAIGLVASLPLIVTGTAHPVVGAVLAIALLAVVSGGLHLDGLADTFDALAAPPSAADRARTDPRAGTAGVVAIVVILGLDAAALAEIASRGPAVAVPTVVAAAAIARAAAPIWARIAGRRGRTGGGLGAWFADSVTTTEAGLAGATAHIVLAAAAGLDGPIAAAAILAGTAAGSGVAGVVLRLRGQIDGDGYGATIELTFAAILLAVALVA